MWNENEITFLEEGRTGGTDAGKSWWEELETDYHDNPSNELSRSVSGGALHFTQVMKI